MKITIISDGYGGTLTAFIEKSKKALVNSMVADFIIANTSEHVNAVPVYQGEICKMPVEMYEDIFSGISLSAAWTHCIIYKVVKKPTPVIDEFFTAHVKRTDDDFGSLVRDHDAEREIFLNGTWIVDKSKTKST